MRWGAPALLGICGALCMGAADNERGQHGGGHREPSKGQAASEPQPATAIAMPEQAASPADKPKPKEYDDGWGLLSTEGWIAGFTAVLTFATIALGLFTYLLWRETKRAVEDGVASAKTQETRFEDQLKVAAEAAKAATKGADVAERAMTVVERAYVFGGIDALTSTEDGRIKIGIVAYNHGKTPARIRTMRYGVFGTDGNGMIIWPTNADYSQAETHTTDTILGAGREGPLITYSGISPRGILYGQISYDDIFKVKHFSRFCIQYDSLKSEATTAGNETWNEYD